MIGAFLANIFSLLSSKDTQAQIIERITKNPRTSWMGVIVLAIFGAAVALHEAGFVLASGLVAGAGFFLSFMTLLFAKDANPKDPSP